MRDVVLAMMTTVNGRLDDPGAWIAGIGDDVYGDIDQAFEEFDTIVIGTATYAEMVSYWPGAETGADAFAESSSTINQRMARKMNAYQKYVFSRRESPERLAWNNAEQICVRHDVELRTFVHELKARPGGKIHLAGGARLAQTFVRLGLVDEFDFRVHPVVSDGATWFDQLDSELDLDLVGVTTYENGVVRARYRPMSKASED